MLVSSNQERLELDRDPIRGDGIMAGLTPETFQRHVAEFDGMDGLAILDTLVPHRELPTHDPAGYLIAYHRLGRPLKTEHDPRDQGAATDALVDVNSAYDLGVVFASSLVRRNLPEGLDIPPITDLNMDKKRLVGTYLRKSQQQPLRRLASRDSKDLSDALTRFTSKCTSELPKLMFDGDEELRRGCHDYLSVVGLLEADQKQQAGLLRRFLGRFSLASFLSGSR